MPKQTLDNLYHGINAHLHSMAQNPQQGSPTIWTAFHAAHIGHLIDAMNVQLPPHYVARAEQSLQIWTEQTDYPDAPPLMRQTKQPDVAIWRTQAGDATYQPAATGHESVRIINLDAFMQREITIPSAVVYRVRDHEIIGQPVTRIELLSASNKRGGSGYTGYVDNRWHAILSGTSLIELDYLHESATPLPGIGRYPHDDDSHPYLIGITDRRPNHTDNTMLVYMIDVDMPLPQTAHIPLMDDDSLIFDFDAVYQHTFRVGRWGLHVDYAQEPRQISRYAQADQARIRQVMQRPLNVSG